MSNTYTSLVPDKPVLLRVDSSVVISSLDITTILSHGAQLLKKHTQLYELCQSSNISNQASITSLSRNLLTLLEKAADEFTTTLYTLPQQNKCSLLGSRKKRAAIYQDTGLFPGLGRFLSIVAGTLSADAAQVINAHTKQIASLREANLAVTEAISDTLKLAKYNKRRMKALEAKIDQIQVTLNSQLADAIKIASINSIYIDLEAAIVDFRTQIQSYVQIWLMAIQGRKHPSLFKEQFMTLVSEALGPKLTKIKNIKYILSQTSKAALSICSHFVWLTIALPVFQQPALSSFRVFYTPSHTPQGYMGIPPDYPLVAFSTTSSLSFTEQEFSSCKELKEHFVCEPPQLALQPEKDCLYAQYVHLKLTCSPIKLEEPPKPFIEMLGKYIVFNLLEMDQIANIVCGTNLTAKALPPAGIISLPFGCSATIQGKTLYNRNPSAKHTYVEHPKFLFPDTNFTFTYKNLTMDLGPEANPEIADQDIRYARTILQDESIFGNQDVIILTSSFSIVCAVILAVFICFVCYVYACPPCKPCLRPVERPHRPSI